MLKPKLLFAVFACLTVTFAAFAQDSSEQKLTYAQQVQKLLDQSTANTKKQFEQSYPKPAAPTIQSSPSNNSSPNQGQQNVVPPPKNPNSKPAPTMPANNEGAQNTNQAVNNAPVFAPGTQQNQQKDQQPSQNMFMPQNNQNNSGNSAGAPAPNPYH
jgi:hypothetical protein